MERITRRAALALGLVAGFAGAAAAQGPTEILNVSYDIGRELFAEINPAFIEAWKKKTGQTIAVTQSHAGTSRQARAILEGLPADVVTFNQALDIQVLHDRGQLVAADWQTRLPNRSSPYYSLPAFLVRKGNPKQVKDWSDLARTDVRSVFPNPRTSGNARYTYLAATAYGLEASKGDAAKAAAFVKAILDNVPVFDSGGRGSTTTFIERQIGDVLITFEAEANGIRRAYGLDMYEVVIPSMSLLAEFPVAVVDRVVDGRGSRAVATAYLEYLYAPEAQEILARHHNRVHDAAVAARHADRFPAVRLVTVEAVFGGWTKANATHFAEGGTLDRIFTRR